VEAIRQHEQQRFEELLVSKPNRAARPMAFLMDTATRHGRGIGKTAFLNHQRRRVMEDLGLTLTEGAYCLFAIHVLPPAGPNSRKFWQFARLLIHTLTEQEVIAGLLCRLRAFSNRVPDEVLDEATDLATTIGDDQWLVRRGVDVENDLVPAVTKNLIQAGVAEGLAAGLAKHGHSPEAFRQDFLRHISDYRWRQLAGPWLYNDLVTALRLGGFNRGLVLVDDFEKVILAQNTVERRTFADDVRYSFVDGPTSAARFGFFGFLWVIYPYIQELLINHWNAAGLARFCALGGDGAAASTLDFTPMTLEETQRLVAAYIEAARRPAPVQDPLWPLDAEAVAAAFRITKGLPGYLLPWLNLAVEQAIRDQWPAIDAARLTEFARQLPPRLPDETQEAAPLAPLEVSLQGDERDCSVSSARGLAAAVCFTRGLGRPTKRARPVDSVTADRQEERLLDDGGEGQHRYSSNSPFEERLS
jgi:hypothetical protein